ncbi:MAG TPA: DUF934 domain-containing protein [Steroidobacteraceae bacterium]|nr:DUF934 domain-containing protein [Steroidobacteraceae bacterium]
MPRRLLRDGRIAVDEWTYLTEAGDAVAPGSADSPDAVILTFDQWQSDDRRWRAAPQRLGVILSPFNKVEQLAPDLSRFDLVGAEFAGPSEGRGYTQGRLLRERYGWRGELRATGYVRRDQVFFLARCGFNCIELPEADLGAAAAAFSTFTARYQPSNDLGLGRKLQHR